MGQRVWLFPASAPPLYLEDGNIFQNSATVVLSIIIMQFDIEPWRPIFESPQNKKNVFPLGILSHIGCVGTLFV
jgi:hypothetical protein